MGIVIITPEGRSISTTFKTPGTSSSFPWQSLPTSSDTHLNVPPETVPEAARLVSNTLGLREFNVVVVVNGVKKSVSDCNDLSEKDQEAIANLVISFNETLY